MNSQNESVSDFELMDYSDDSDNDSDVSIEVLLEDDTR